MKSLNLCFVILLLSLLTSKSNSMPDAREDKSLSFYNSLPQPQHIEDLVADPLAEFPFRRSFMGGDSSMGGYESKGGSYAQLKRVVDMLSREFAELKSSETVCNPLMPDDSVVIGTVCYYLSSTPEKFADALQKCRSYGGTLAEPLPGFSVALWNELIRAFPVKMAAILSASGQLWIGAKNAASTTPFKYESTLTDVVPPFTCSPPCSVASGALMEAPGTPWDYAALTDSKPYLCWSNPISTSKHSEYSRPFSGSYGYSEPYRLRELQDLFK